jgi:osmotically-inducible protein OsmY
MNSMKRIVLGVVAAATVAGLAGCASWRSNNGERTAGRMVDDNHITAQIKSGLANEPVYKFNDVDVKTFDGVVQLSGFVNTEEQKQRASDIAQHTAGVARVVNSITLKPNSTQPTGRETAPTYNANPPR